MYEMEVEGDIGDIDPNDVNVDDSDDVRGISGRLKALQSVTVFVQVRVKTEQLSSRSHLLFVTLRDSINVISVCSSL
jgi:hypothetical protein